MPERIWHSISRLELFVGHTRRWADDVREHLETLEEARTTPYVLADSDVARIKGVYSEQVGDLTLFEEQAAKWGEAGDLSASQRAQLKTLNEQLAGLRELNKEVLDLADELDKGTIDAVMAASAGELGLMALLGSRPARD